jgi:hypothetical protein
MFYSGRRFRSSAAFCQLLFGTQLAAISGRRHSTLRGVMLIIIVDQFGGR